MKSGYVWQASWLFASAIYHRTGAGNIKEMLRLTVHARCFVFLAFLALVVLKYAAIPLAGFGIVDLLGALWTWAALKKEK